MSWHHFLFGSPLFSYHVKKDFGNNEFLYWWPSSGFGKYCTDEKEARFMFEKISNDEPDSSLQLVKFPCVTSTFRWKILGITGNGEKLAERIK